jgi:hypothetical protein
MDELISECLIRLIHFIIIYLPVLRSVYPNTGLLTPNKTNNTNKTSIQYKTNIPEYKKINKTNKKISPNKMTNNTKLIMLK